MQQHLMCILSKQSDWHRLSPVITHFHKLCADNDYANLAELKWTLLYTGLNEEINKSMGQEPDYCLGVTGGSFVMQMAKIFASIEPIFEQLDPSAILITSDTPASFAVAMVAYQKKIPIIYLNAQIKTDNGKILDTMASMSLYSDEYEMQSLKSVQAKRTRLPKSVKSHQALTVQQNAKRLWVGNTLACYLQQQTLQPLSVVCDQLGIDESEFDYGFILVSLTHPNVLDKPQLLQNLIKTFFALAMAMPIVMIAHPKLIEKLPNLKDDCAKTEGLHLVAPLEYPIFVSLLKNSRLVISDSQTTAQECQMMEVPMIDLLENQDLKSIMKSVQCHLSDGGQSCEPHPSFSHSDKQASTRVVDTLISFFNLKCEEVVLTTTL